MSVSLLIDNFWIDFFAESCIGFGFEDLTFHVGTDGVFQQFRSFCRSSSKLKFRAELARFVELILSNFSLRISDWEADWMHWNQTVSESCPLIHGINQGWPTGCMRPKLESRISDFSIIWVFSLVFCYYAVQKVKSSPETNMGWPPLV